MNENELIFMNSMKRAKSDLDRSANLDADVVSCAECGSTYRWEPMTARLYDGHWVDFNDDDIEYQLGVTVTHWLPIAVPPEK